MPSDGRGRLAIQPHGETGQVRTGRRTYRRGVVDWPWPVVRRAVPKIDGVALMEKLAASHRHQSREGRESEEPLPHEVEELQRPPRADSPALVYKTHPPEGSEETKSDCHTAKPRVQ